MVKAGEEARAVSLLQLFSEGCNDLHWDDVCEGA